MCAHCITLCWHTFDFFFIGNERVEKDFLKTLNIIYLFQPCQTFRLSRLSEVVIVIDDRQLRLYEMGSSSQCLIWWSIIIGGRVGGMINNSTGRIEKYLCVKIIKYFFLPAVVFVLEYEWHICK